MSPVQKARYIMIGGFLGAGKSTSVSRLARRLTDQGPRVGLITNDQGAGLVDTRNLRSQGFDVEEIAGGCFCCRFDSLKSAAEKLSAETRPEVFLAEPVGSCTDLLATVTYPLRRLYGDSFTIAPLSVVVDPRRAARVLGLTPGRSFSSKVSYVYLKQLEEAQVIVINKIDAVTQEELGEIHAALAERFPESRIFEVSARTGEGLDAWFDHITSAAPIAGRPLDIDYQTYGEGEALLGWLNSTVRVTSPRDGEFDGNVLLRDMARSLQQRLVDCGAEVAHLKMTLSPDGGFRELGLVNLVHQDFVPEVGQELPSPLNAGELVINLRAEAAPELLLQALEAEIESRTAVSSTSDANAPDTVEVKLRLEHLESFRPGQPDPTHRMTTWADAREIAALSTGSAS